MFIYSLNAMWCSKQKLYLIMAILYFVPIENIKHVKWHKVYIYMLYYSLLISRAHELIGIWHGLCQNHSPSSTTTTTAITLLVQKTRTSLHVCAACIVSVMIHDGFRSGYKRERAHLEKSSTASVYYSIPKISLSVTLKISSEGKKWSEGSYK